ncbi:hypothetical protein NDU88_007025 [Pleurodeles waltl]|uniref:Pre-rRNA-processing protein Ipi1 N-terminal domain-containing protein n=1 Tax=Pleurodeles waltl TaxID=8319 RepID=A0AAV7VPI8_PLEWA|nr:hypothetical protein NDU88_007025 [Pleurodeles waltl]
MAKKRRRQDDFQKVKLKVGQKKIRPENSTQSNFRTKAIRLPEQLRCLNQQQLQPTNNRKLSVQDLLSQIHHYNASVRQGALLGLRDLLSLHPTMIDAHLSSIVSEVAAMFTDKDPTVRGATVSLLQLVAPKIPMKQMSPFFPLISAHLSSAMTHIVEAIQEDSLLVFDVLLDEYPILLASRSNMLLKNFVELISHHHLSKGAKGAVKSSAWTLSVNPNRTLTSQQWSLNVLIRLKKLLQALSDNALNNSEEGEALFSRKDLADLCHDFKWLEHASGQQHIEIYEGGECWIPLFSLRSLVSVGGSLEEGLSSAEKLKGFIESIIPLLIECWVEASSAQPSSGNILKPESQQLMQQVLNIIYLLWRLSEQQDKIHKMEVWLRTKYLKDFNHFFMNHFPYFVCDPATYLKTPQGKRQTGFPSNGLDHLLLNLTLCDIMVSLANSSTFQSDSDWLDRIRKFVTEILMDGWKLNWKQLNRLLGVTWRLMVVQRNRVSTERLIRAVYMLYQQKNLAFPVRSLLLNFFSRIYLRDEDFNLLGSNSRNKALFHWLSSLPVQLVQLSSRNPELSTQLIDTIHAAAARSNKELLSSLQATACQIYDPHDGILVLLPAESQKRLVQLLYFLPCMPKNLLACLNRCCIMGRLSSSTAAAIVGILHTRSTFSGWTSSVESSIMSDVDYFSFLFSTLAGFSSEELSWLQDSRGRPHICHTHVSPVHLFLTDHNQFVHHCTVTEAVCQSLSTIPARSQCLDIIHNAIHKHLADFLVIPDSMAASILRATTRLVDQSCLPSDNLKKFLASCSCSLLFYVVTLENENAKLAEKREMLWQSCISFFAALPCVLRLVLQNFQVSKLHMEELPVISKMLTLLLQQGQLKVYIAQSAFLIQQIVQDITTLKSGEMRELWLADLQYCFNVYLTSQPSN